jgi:hypothetical protein
MIARKSTSYVLRWIESYAQLIRGDIYMRLNRVISYDRLDRLIDPVMGAILQQMLGPNYCTEHISILR